MSSNNGSHDPHEVRTALAICRGAAELLGDPEPRPEHWDEAVDLMIGGLARLDSVDLTVLEPPAEPVPDEA